MVYLEFKIMIKKLFLAIHFELNIACERMRKGLKSFKVFTNGSDRRVAFVFFIR